MDNTNVLSKNPLSAERCATAERAREAVPNVVEIATRGERIYERRYKKDYEALYFGRFVAIDIESELTYFGSTPAEAYSEGLRASPRACLFLVKVGSAAAYEFKGGYRYARSMRAP